VLEWDKPGDAPLLHKKENATVGCSKILHRADKYPPSREPLRPSLLYQTARIHLASVRPQGFALTHRHQELVEEGCWLRCLADNARNHGRSYVHGGVAVDVAVGE
jgi:hypothetical protein